jgi:UDP-2-acetamido-3-amino-2,3-dideoxy-glucuronate N-acetyltransferase
MRSLIHPTSDIQSLTIGKNTVIARYCVVLKGAIIGNNCNIGPFVFIENDVIIGNNVTIKPNVALWDGVRLEEDVFVAVSVRFTNDLLPRSKDYKPNELTIVKKGAFLGSNTCILPGLTIGEYARTGICSVITRDVPAFALVNGSPAVIEGFIANNGLSPIP